MKKSGYIFLALTCLLIGSSCYATAPALINFQGDLADTIGNPINGEYGMVFSFYSAETDGTLYWQESHDSVPVTDGIINVLLGDGTKIGGAKASFEEVFDEPEVYLAIRVNPDTDMYPRQQIVSVGYALRANLSETVRDNSITTVSIVDNSVTEDKLDSGAVTMEKLADNSVTADKIQPDIVSSINGIANDGGDIVLEAGDNVTIEADDTADTIKISVPNMGIVPIGSIIAWTKSMGGVPALPEQFVECNGQVLNDPESALNGQAIPNLNGENRFLRGSVSSGSTGGSTSHNHQWADDYGADGVPGIKVLNAADNITSASYNSAGSRIGFSYSQSSFTLDGDYWTKNTTALPPYYNIVWIMRVK
jgi:hypothetical protein